MPQALTVTCNSIVPFRKKETFTILCLRVGPGISACCTFYHRSMEPARLCTRTHGVQSSPVWEARVEMSLLLDLLEILSTSRPVQYAAYPQGERIHCGLPSVPCFISNCGWMPSSACKHNGGCVSFTNCIVELQVAVVV